MKYRYIKLIAILFGVLLAYGCSSDVYDKANNTETAKEYTYSLVLDVNRPSFSDNPKTRAGEDGWEDGDEIIVTLNGNVGYARYDKNNDNWTLRTYKSLTAESGKCGITHVDGYKLSEGWNQILNTKQYDTYGMGSGESYKTFSFAFPEGKAIYTGSATYFKKDGVVHLAGFMEALCSRVRFVSKTPTTIKIRGFYYFTGLLAQLESYNGIEAGGYFNYDYITDKEIKLDRQLSDGTYTSDYLYGVLSSGKNVYLMDMADTEHVFTQGNNKTFARMKDGYIGFSGVVTVPTQDSHDNWTMRGNVIKTIYTTIEPSDNEYSSGDFIWYSNLPVTGDSIRKNQNDVKETRFKDNIYVKEIFNNTNDDYSGYGLIGSATLASHHLFITTDTQYSHRYSYASSNEYWYNSNLAYHAYGDGNADYGSDDEKYNFRIRIPSSRLYILLIKGQSQGTHSYASIHDLKLCYFSY